MESELGTGLNRQNPRNERVVDLIHMGDTWLRLSCIGGIGQPLPREINDHVRGLERLIGGNRGKGDPAGNAAGLPIIRFGPTSSDEEQQTRKARYEETQRLVPDRCHKNISWDLFPAIMVRAGTPHSPDSHFVERTSHDTTVARLPFAEARREPNRPLVPEPLARNNYEGASSHLKRKMSNILPSRPLVGRTYELEVLGKALASAQAGSGTATFLRGDTGTGKSRLASAVVEEAAHLGFETVSGQAYRMDTGVPYGLWSNAFFPKLREMDDATLSVLTRGGEEEVSIVVPGLRSGSTQDPVFASVGPGELRTRIHWNFTELLRGLSKRTPLLVVLDDLHWSDPSGLDLFHFVSRQIAEVPLVLLGVYNTKELVHNPAFQNMERPLLSVSGSEALDVGPLSADETVDLVLRTFQVDAGIGEPLARQIHERAGGNPYFVEEILKSLVDSGKLFLQDERWLGWEVVDLDLPASVTEAVSARFGELSSAAREVANVLAVAGTRVDHQLLTTVAEQNEADILAGLDQLRTGQLIHEASDGAHILYRFLHHPLVQEVIYSEMGLARARTLHLRMGEALERGDAPVIDDPVHALAYHFSHAGGEDPRVVRYLAAAGRDALESRANREAAGFLKEAIERVRAGAFTEEDTGVAILPLEEDLARVLQRLGKYRRATDHWKAALEMAVERTDTERAAALHYRIGQAASFPGRFDEAVTSYTAGLEYAKEGSDRAIEARLHLYKGIALQAQGSADEARREMETALAVAETVADPSLLARVRRELMILHHWLGDLDEAREHGRMAIALSEEAGDRQITFWVYWALAIGEGFLGEVEVMDRHIQRWRKIAKELRSPVLRLWTSEVLLEHAMAAGEWNYGITLGEQAVARARVLGQDALLPRLLVWLSLIYLGRGEIERGRACVDEAWMLSGAGTEKTPRVHLVVPAHIGKAAYHLAAKEYEEAIRIGEAGLAIAENSEFIIWAVHRLLPLIGEAYLQIHDTEAGVHIEERMLRYGKKLNTRSGLAWLSAYEAVKVWYSGDIERGTVLMRKAAEDLEEVPMIYDAARLGRQLAGRLADLGKTRRRPRGASPRA